MSAPGYRFHDPTLPAATLTASDFENMKRAVLLGDADLQALRRSHDLLASRTEEILDVWYGFVGSHDFLLASFTDTQTGAPLGEYLGRVRARFAQWILDTAKAEYDSAWLAWQLEIGRRHHRIGKNRTDSARASAIVPYRYLPLLAQPIVDTLRPFLAAPGVSRDDVDAMQNAWRKSVLLQVTLWSQPYVIAGDF
jgi:Protoglobin